MRLLPTFIAAVGLLAGHVRSQHRNGFGFMDGLAPRSWPLAVAKPPVLGKRDGSCASGQHPCSDVNSTLCCPNTQYCLINTSWEVQCCEIGSTCGGPCDEQHYFANETITTTITASASLTAVTTTTITQGVCSGRSCSGSFYGCPSSLGGNCCGYGLNCATNTAGAGICIGVSSATSSMSSTAATSTSSALPTGTIIEHKSSGLSPGAKAGIAVGVIVVAALVIGAFTYLCLRRRRNGARSETTTAQELPSMAPAGRGAAAAAAAAAAASGPHMSEADGDAMSYGYAPSSTGLSRGGNGPAQGDYFGEEGGGARGAPQQYPQDQPRHQHRPPHRPENVVAPVEIGTRLSLRGRPPGSHVRMESQGSEADGSQSELADTSSRGPSPAFGSGSGGPASPVESIAGRFELYGDFGMATTTSGKEEFYDAQESARGTRSRGAVVGGSGTVLPQPFPTPGSEMSEFATPSPMSREEEAQLRRET